MISLNALDLLLIVFLLIGIVIGAIRGFGRQVMALASAWLGLIICLWLYRPFSRQILMGMFDKSSTLSGGNVAVFDTFAFIMLLIVFSALIQLLIVQTTKSPEERTDASGKTFVEKANEKAPVRIGSLIGGIVMGFIISLIWLSVVIAPIRFVVFSINTNSAFINGLRGAMASSGLLPVLARVLNWVYVSIQYFIPSTGLPSIFSGFLNSV